MQSVASYTDLDAGPKTAVPWLVCMETQRLHFAPESGQVSPSFYVKVEACRRLLAHARQEHWRVIHVHRQRSETPSGRSDPELRPIDGLAPLPTERVYVRYGSRSLGLANDPFWRDAATACGARMIMVGHLSLQGIVEVSATAAEAKVELAIVSDAVWRRAAEAPFADQSLPLVTLKRLRAMRPPGEDDRYSPANTG